MSYEEKITQAKRVLEEHNSADPEHGIDIDQLVRSVKALGGTTEDTLAEFTYEDLQGAGLPVALARRIARIFRTKNGEQKVRHTQIITQARAQVMRPEELLTHYDPREADNPVGKRLQEMSKSKPFIVFHEDGRVNEEVSAVLLQEIRDGYTERESYVVDGRPQKTHRVGERPDQMADVNPLYPNRVLRPDGMCDQTGRSWQGVLHEVRALVYLAVTETKEINVTLETAHNVLDIVMSEDAAARLRTRYMKASLRYDEFEKAGKLPSLKVPLTQGGASPVRPNNPFPGEHKREY